MLLCSGGLNADEMREEDLIQRLLQAEAAHLAALACNRLLVAAAGLFACIALLLSGALGFVLGQLSSSNHEVRIVHYLKYLLVEICNLLSLAETQTQSAFRQTSLIKIFALCNDI